MAVDLTVLDRAVRARRGELDQQTGVALDLARRGQEAVAETSRLKSQLELYEKACGVLTSFGEERQQQAQHQVEELVTRALQVIFGEELSFRLVPRVVRDQVTIEFVLVSQYGTTTIETPVMDARGGGHAAVVGFVMQLVVLLLTPDARRFLALDETFAYVSESFVPRLAEFLREAAYKAEIQIMLVTHSTGYGDVADQRYRLVLGPDGVTQAHEGESE